jgi:hypothetical protein
MSLETDTIGRLIEAAQRLRVVRAAQRRFITLWAVDHMDAFLSVVGIPRSLSRDLFGDRFALNC